MPQLATVMRRARKITAEEIYNCGNIKAISVFHSLSFIGILQLCCVSDAIRSPDSLVDAALTWGDVLRLIRDNLQYTHRVFGIYSLFVLCLGIMSTFGLELLLYS